MALPLLYDMAANCRRYIRFCRDWPPGQSCRKAARRRTVGDTGPYQDVEQKDRRGRRSLRKQTTGRFPAAAGGHAFSRGEGGFFIALIGGNEKDGCGMREIAL